MLSRSLILITLAAAPCLLSFAGPLDPPPGPIEPTSKTLAEIEPRTPINVDTTPGDDDSVYRITQPGSYYLTGHLDGAKGKSGIEIASDNVTIDLRGFTLIGAPSSLAGIESGGNSGVVVLNGRVAGWPEGGVLLAGAPRARVENVTVERSGGVGIQVGASGIVRACVVAHAGAGPTVAGIQAGQAALIESCRVNTASASGAHGIDAASYSAVRNCDVTGCGGVGIRLTDYGVVTGCQVYLSAGDGIAAGAYSRVTDCVVKQSQGRGIWLTFHGVVSRCEVTNCSGSGIQVSTGNTVSNCQANYCAGPGIEVMYFQNRIENNCLLFNGTGLRVGWSGNVIFGNRASSNNPVNFNIVAGNVGLFKNAAVGEAFTGSDGGVDPGSSNANTNYAY